MRTLQEIENCGKETLSPSDIAPFLGCNAYSISLQAQENPKMLGFPVIVVKTRTRIPREGFVNFCRYNMVGAPIVSLEDDDEEDQACGQN